MSALRAQALTTKNGGGLFVDPHRRGERKLFESKQAGIKGVVSGVTDVVGGGVISGIGKAISGLADVFGIGGTPEAVKEEGRATADKFISGGPNATSVRINDEAIRRYGFPRPTANGEFYLWRATGEVFAITSYSGMVPHKSAWATEVTKRWTQFLSENDIVHGADAIHYVPKRKNLLASGTGGMPLLIGMGVLLAFTSKK